MSVHKIDSENLQNVLNYAQTSTGNTEHNKTSDTELAEALSKYKGYKPEEETETTSTAAEPEVEARSKSSSNRSKYLLGRRVNNTRIIGVDSVYTAGEFSLNGLQIHNGKISFGSGNGLSQYSNTTDGYFGDSSQAQRGDCYFLAEINAIRNTKSGQAALKQNCRKNSDGSYTVTLTGAKKVRAEYAKRGMECQITGTYKISKEALQKAGKSDKYSKGDLEVVAYELAMEAYRAELSLTQRQYGYSQSHITADGQHIGGMGNGDVLSGGFPHDAGFVITGKKSEVYTSNNNRYARVKPYSDGKYGYISREEMARRTGADISMYHQTRSVGVSEVSSYTENEKAIYKMLNKYQGKEGNYALTVNVRVAENGPDGKTRAGDGHALSVVKITQDTVYVANPWHPDKIEPIPKNEFIKMTTGLSAMPVTKPQPQDQLSALLSYLKK